MRASWQIPVMAFGVLGCVETVQPVRRPAAVQLFPTLAAPVDLSTFNLAIDNARLLVLNQTADTVHDVTAAFAIDQDAIRIEAHVVLAASPETVTVTLQLRAGPLVLFTGGQTLELRDGAAAPVPLVLSYVGPGGTVARLTLDPLDSVLTFGDLLPLRLTARDGQNNIVSSFYTSWTSSDTTLALVDALGRVTAPARRGAVVITAQTPNGVSTTTPLTFIPVPTALQVVSGCGQSALAGLTLAQPFVVRVIAADGLGVKGIIVNFGTVLGGGTVGTPQAVTDAQGLAQTGLTLGLLSGLNRFQATVSGIAGALSCDATAL
jgi:hypothetical protein